jgi:hypothetical protein
MFPDVALEVSPVETDELKNIEQELLNIEANVATRAIITSTKNETYNFLCEGLW